MTARIAEFSRALARLTRHQLAAATVIKIRPGPSRTNYNGAVGQRAGLLRRQKVLVERALGAELTEHLGYENGDPAGRGTANSRNRTTSKTVLTKDGEVEISIPRDRAGSFEPQLIAKGQTRFDGFDDEILSLYARRTTVREIQATWLNFIAPRPGHGCGA